MVREKIRVSLGSAILLGLTEGVIDAVPTTIYLLTYRAGKCAANCGFCAQARTSTARADLLSRVTWPVFPTKEVIDRIKSARKGLIKRVCVQTMNYPDMFGEVSELVRRIHAEAEVPVSISCQPLDSEQMKQLKEAGVDRVGIPLDTPTERLFKEIKGSAAGGPYIWDRHMEALEIAVRTLGRGKVSTHLIVGLGERDEELVRMVQRMVDVSVYPALFAFTPIPGTRLEDVAQPQLGRYRRIQLAHHLITMGKARFEDIVFDDEGRIVGFNLDEGLLREAIRMGIPFMTSGCPGCNRPFYNERVGGPLYNYPRPLSAREIDEIEAIIFDGV